MVNGIQLEGDHQGMEEIDKYERLESLLVRRPFLLCEVKLQRNINDVSEWMSLI
jgi:hypothetical protein